MNYLMPLAAGTRLGPYEILAPIGAGGMGEVYKARDTRLDRQVAVKISAEQFSERFAREARAVAALNHPNIVALYDVGDNYIVTELVEGESLRTAHTTMRKAIDIAAQIADGLAAAHAAAIVHRDLKPENIMVTRDGRAKILDFGLSRQSGGTGPDNSTRTLPGTVMGTAGYMSPEQVRGQESDHRADIFSFGVVLYEMLAGHRAFRADTAAELMTAILKQDPSELPLAVPPALREIVRHCVEKEPAARFQSAKDLAFALRSLLGQSSTTEAAAAISDTRRPRHWWIAAAAVTTAAAAFTLGWFSNRHATLDLANYRFTPIASEAGPEQWPAWSPDGKTLAYAALVNGTSQIFTRRMDAPVPDQITHEPVFSTMPFWSKNGDRIFFNRGHDELWSIATMGGAAERVLDNVSVAALASDGVSMAVARATGASELAFGKLGGNEWKAYKKPPFDQDFSGRLLRFSPDGSKLAVLFSRTNSGQGEIWEVPYPAERGTPRKLFADVPGGTTFVGFSWMPDSRRLVIAMTRYEGPVQLFLGDSGSGRLRKLTAGMESRTTPAVSPDGKRIAYVEQSLDSDLVEVMLDGSAVRPVLATARVETSALWHPNGREFVYVTDASGTLEPWVRNVEDDRARPLIPNARDVLPEGLPREIAIAPDGERLAVGTWGKEHTIWLFRRSGGKAVRVDPGNADQHAPAWSPDGNWIAYGRVRPKEQLTKAPAGGGTPVVLATLEWQGGPTEVVWSPTGEWIAWAADTLTLYSPDGKQQKKLGAARSRQQIAFSRDGKTLYTYFGERGTRKWIIEAFDVASGRSRQTASFELDATTSLSGLALHPDGKRFLATMDKNNPDIVLLEGF